MVTSVVKLLALASVALAMPATNSSDSTINVDATNFRVRLCRPASNDPAHGVICDWFPVFPRSCSNLNHGAASAFFRQVSQVTVPAGLVCNFFRNSGCAGDRSDYVVLVVGQHNLERNRVPNGYGQQIWFDRQAGSYVCQTFPFNG